MGASSCQPLAKRKGWWCASLKLYGHEGVDMAGAWDESHASYRGRPHGRMETEYEARLKKICREESVEAIVQRCSRHRRKV
jgi:hypothetical protein